MPYNNVFMVNMISLGFEGSYRTENSVSKSNALWIIKTVHQNVPTDFNELNNGNSMKKR